MKELNNIKAVIFDLDGTLIDTEKYYRRFWKEACKSLGYDLKDEQALMLRSLGKPYAEPLFKSWFGKEADYQAVRGLRRKLMDPYVQREGIEVKKGAFELLDFLKEKGIYTAIATQTPMERLEDCLQRTGLQGHFDKLVSASLVERGKPAPDVYLYACRELGIDPKECIAVEDSPNGVSSAYNAGLRVILVPDQSSPTKEEVDKAFIIVDNLDLIRARRVKFL